jgi:hypothetical protein
MAEFPASEVRLAAQIRAHQSWAQTVDRSARTAPARAALERRFLVQAGGDPVRAEHLRTAYYKWLALQSAASRRRNRERRAAASRDDVAS